MDLKKPLLMKTAEVVDAWRVVPRLVLVAYGALTLHVVNWFMTIPEPTTSQMVLVTTISGLSAAVIGLYNNSSKNWNEYNREFTDRVLKLNDPEAYISLTTARAEESQMDRNSYRPSYMPRRDYNDRYTSMSEYDAPSSARSFEESRMNSENPMER